MLKILIFCSVFAISYSCRTVLDRSSGGINVARTDFSSVALIETFIKYDRKYWCVGSLISPNYVLTTARCIINGMFANVHINAYKFFDEFEMKREIYRATEFVIKEPFDRYINHNDIALIKLPITLNMAEKTYKIAHLPTSSETSVNSTGKSIGWGLYDFYDDDENVTEFKQEIELNFMEENECFASYGARLNNTNIGVAGRGCLIIQRGVNCVSGYGSPFFIGDEIHALHSFGAYQYCTSDLPNGVTLINYYHLPWIRENSDIV